MEHGCQDQLTHRARQEFRMASGVCIKCLLTPPMKISNIKIFTPTTEACDTCATPREKSDLASIGVVQDYYYLIMSRCHGLSQKEVEDAADLAWTELNQQPPDYDINNKWGFPVTDVHALVRNPISFI